MNLLVRIYLAVLTCTIRVLRLTKAGFIELQLRSAEHRMRRAILSIQLCRDNQVFYQIKANQLRKQLSQTLRH